ESGGMHCTIWHKLPGRGPLAVYWVSADGKQLPVGEIFFDKGLGLSTFQDHVFQLRDAGTQEVLAAVRMFPGRIVLTIDEAFLAAIASCDNIPHDTWTGSCDGEAASGGCVTNPGFMTVFCSRSCHACHLRQTEQRCTRRFLDMDQHPALRPGDMNQMFRDIVSRAKKYSYNITVLSKSPWIVTFDNFVSEAEIADMLSNVKEFQRSSDQGEYDEFGLMKGIISSKRTSKTAWCLDTCKASPSYLAVRERISDVIQVPSANFEEMQFLNYAIGEKYVEHHDMNNISDNDHACGPRIYTFFLYLSDVEEGGETNFPRLNISVKPRKGSALLWPSVLSHNPAAPWDEKGGELLGLQRRPAVSAERSRIDPSERERRMAALPMVRVVAYNATISACSRSGLWQEAVGLLEELRGSSKADVVSFTGACGALQRSSHWQEALSLGEAMRRETPPNIFSFGALLAACEKGERWREALAMMEEMQSQTVQVNTVAMNSAIGACGKGQRWEAAFHLFAHGQKSGMKTTDVTFGALMTALERGGQWAKAVSLLSKMRQERRAGLLARTAAARACGREGQWRQALQIFADAAADGLRPDLAAYHVAMAACVQGAWPVVLELLGLMRRRALEPNAGSFALALQACERQARWPEALEVLSQLLSSGTPSPELFTSAISACSKGSRWDVACGLLGDMQRRQAQMRSEHRRSAQMPFAMPLRSLEASASHRPLEERNNSNPRTLHSREI
ncbi:unnamed protein product, partial [Effrenium voratum]